MKRLLAVLLLVCAGCASTRYLGSVGRDRSYVNRGYGFLVRTAHAGLSDRFDAIVLENFERFPSSVRPKLTDTALDLDGDGFLDVTEQTKHLVPALRLLSRTSTSVYIDVDVQILSTKNTNTPLAEIVLGDIRRATVTSTSGAAAAQATIETTRLAPDYDAQIYELPGQGRRIAVIDHEDFRAEERIARRQIVRVTLVQPKLDRAGRTAHREVLEALILNRRGGIETTREEW